MAPAALVAEQRLERVDLVRARVLAEAEEDHPRVAVRHGAIIAEREGQRHDMLLPAAALVLAAGCGGANPLQHAAPLGFGSWSLACLGYHDLVLREDENDAMASRSITYHLPPGARQGHGSWWLIRLHFS